MVCKPNKALYGLGRGFPAEGKVVKCQAQTGWPNPIRQNKIVSRLCTRLVDFWADASEQLGRLLATPVLGVRTGAGKKTIKHRHVL